MILEFSLDCLSANSDLFKIWEAITLSWTWEETDLSQIWKVTALSWIWVVTVLF